MKCGAAASERSRRRYDQWLHGQYEGWKAWRALTHEIAADFNNLLQWIELDLGVLRS